jgi:serine/threonine protein kinase
MPNNVSLPKGFKLNEYQIAKKLSTGGFSVVYLAYDKHGQPVAIKEFFPNNLHLRSKGQHIDFINMREKHRFQEGLKGFKDETEIVMRLKHRNIIEIINFFELNGTAYIVMPYEYGMTLGKYIALEKNPKESEIASIIEGVFSAVQMFHENNIIHLDLKPGNIWLRPNKEALILDFGTARIINDPVKSKQPPMHTPGYAAPEQHKEFFQPNRVGVWTDYYGLGTTLYALIERSAPTPSPQLLLKGEKIDIISRRKGQYSDILLKIIEYLMQPEWDLRKKIDLKQIITQLQKVRPIQETTLVTELLRNEMDIAEQIFKTNEEAKEKE